MADSDHEGAGHVPHDHAHGFGLRQRFSFDRSNVHGRSYDDNWNGYHYRTDHHDRTQHHDGTDHHDRTDHHDGTDHHDRTQHHNNRRG